MSYLVLHAGDSAFVTPIEILGEIVGRKDRCLLGIVGEAESQRVQSEVPALEFLWGQVREFGDAVDGFRVQLLVDLGSAEVIPEDAEAVVVLLLRCVALAELELKPGEMVRFRLEDCVIGNDLLNQRIVKVSGWPRDIQGSDEQRSG